mgnify:CR=1 FL=1
MRNIITANHDKAPNSNASWQIVKKLTFLATFAEISKNLCQNKRYATAKPTTYITTAVIIPRISFYGSCTCFRFFRFFFPIHLFWNTAFPS